MKQARARKISLSALGEVRKRCLRQVLSLHNDAHSGHIGSSLSCLDLLIYLFGFRIQDEDELILSKGHAGSALYTVLAEFGRIPKKLLSTYYQDGTILAAHPPCGHKLSAIRFGTGSLGHGLSIASGLAFSTRFTGKEKQIYCVLSDGDCNEGSTWEAALFAAHHKLDNLNIVIDRNNLQGFGKSDDILNLEPLREKWQSFGFETLIIKNGNNFESIAGAFQNADVRSVGKPRCFIALTTKGSGVSFMENEMKWHYLPMNEEQYKQALAEVGKD